LRTTATGGPTSPELQTILLAPDPCGSSPCIDPTFGPTQPQNYWSATTSSGDPDKAWFVDFLTGIVNLNVKPSVTGYVGAVRSGS
jgi:hypothetical protein